MPHLNTYSGSWTHKEARHLLKRTTFGATQSLISTSVSLGLTETINRLFTENTLPDPPIKYIPDGEGNGNNEIIDPGANFGQTWVNSDALPEAETTQKRNQILRSRTRSLYAWSFLQMQNSGISIREKLTLFWHNHFVAENNNPHREYYYINLLRSNALKNFKELTKLITIDTNMLLYLSGSQNTNVAPNENYSRELLELFTIGKGDAVGNGDYTNYTEEDVIEIAKILTGWRVRGLNDENSQIAYFSNNRHTQGDKYLSHRFNNAVITENGENEYRDLIDIIFEQEECSRFITRKLYRWFVNYEITDDIEINIIEPLAEIIRNNNYDISQALKKLLSSQHFFETTACMIKSPIDLLFSVTQSLLTSSSSTSSITEEYEYALTLYAICEELEQTTFHHPNVAGWKAYYQEPLFYKTWINNFLLPKRLDYCRIIVTGGNLEVGSSNFNIPPLVPVLLLADEIDNAKNPNVLIIELSNQFFNYEIDESQVTVLKDILIPGLPDFEWTIEYTNFLENPSDEALRNSVENKLRNLISTMVQMSEFQIM